MKHIIRLTFMLTILLAVFVCFPTSTNAQFEQQTAVEDDPGGGPGDPCTDPLEYCPIDEGLYALLAVGIGFGIKRARDARKNSTEPVHF